MLSSIDHYKAIDITNQEIVEFEKLIDGLNKSCALFDIQLPETKFLKQCRRELKLIKVKKYINYLYKPQQQQLSSACSTLLRFIALTIIFCIFVLLR